MKVKVKNGINFSQKMPSKIAINLSLKLNYFKLPEPDGILTFGS